VLLRRFWTVDVPVLDVPDPQVSTRAALEMRFRHAAVASGVRTEREVVMDFILWIIAVVLVVSGIVALLRKELLWGIVLIVVGLLVGPGGVSIFS
jgi:hypothetical protein